MFKWNHNRKSMEDDFWKWNWLWILFPFKIDSRFGLVARSWRCYFVFCLQNKATQMAAKTQVSVLVNRNILSFPQSWWLLLSLSPLWPYPSSQLFQMSTKTNWNCQKKSKNPTRTDLEIKDSSWSRSWQFHRKNIPPKNLSPKKIVKKISFQFFPKKPR